MNRRKHPQEDAAAQESEAARWMQAFASSTELRGGEETALPDPQVLWQSARLAEKYERTELIAMALEWAQVAAAAAIPAGVALWVALHWYAIETATAGLLVRSWPQLSAVAYVVAGLAPAALVVGAVALSYPLLMAED